METEKKKNGIFRAVKIAVNVILLTLLVFIGVQNAHVVDMSILNWTGQISLSLLVFLAGLLGGLVVLVFNLIKW